MEISIDCCNAIFVTIFINTVK